MPQILIFKSYPSWFLFMMTLLLGLILVVCSDNWFMCWIGLELSLLGFLPMVMEGSLSIESAIKYFLIQAGGSTILILSFMLMKEYAEMAYLMSMSMKLGLAPFYQWVPSVLSSLNFLNMTTLLTLQKIGPLIMMMKISTNSYSLLILFSAFSVLIGGLSGVNQTHITPLLAYSSIAHTGWLMLSMVSSLSLCVVYFMAYSMSVMALCAKAHGSTLSKIYKSMKLPWTRTTLSALLLNLSGLPPFPLFFGKLYVVFTLWTIYPAPLSFIVLVSSITVYFYMYNIIPSNTLNLKRGWSKL